MAVSASTSAFNELRAVLGQTACSRATPAST